MSAAALAVATLGSGGSAQAAPPGQVSAAVAVARSCFAAPAPGAPGVDTRTVTADATGMVRARLAGNGDWDVAVFDEKSGRQVAASAGFRTNELAEGYVTKGQRLLVQACRYAGDASTASLSTDVLAVKTGSSGTSSLVQVATPDRAAKQRLTGLGLDVTEHGTATMLEVVAHGPADLQKLKAAGFEYKVTVPDLAKRAAESRADDAAYAAGTKTSPLPSGRTHYRRLADYELEMKQLAARYPRLVKPLVMRYRTIEGRDVHGIEIAGDAANVSDGKAVFMLMGLHHAREWPSGEHAMEFGYDLLKNYRTSESTNRLVNAARTVIVPVINPDGFTVSREAERIGDFGVFDYEMKRKNCRVEPAPLEYRGGTCADNPAGRLRGTDLNRNYPGFWGGPGASPNWPDDTFRGIGPGSEPEVKNVIDFVSQRQVTNLITNHTYSNLILRPPGQYDTQLPADEPVYEALGARMAEHNNYLNTHSFNLYETTGSTEDWSYWNTGGLGFTFEIGDEGFHPPFRNAVVGEYLGRAPAQGAGMGGNRAAYYEMLRSTAAPALHATIQGTAPAGWTLRVHKEFATKTWNVLQPDGTEGKPKWHRDVLDSTYLSDGGGFRWAVNPSTRPYVDARIGREATGPAQAPIVLENPAGIPAENTGDPFTGPHESIPFEVLGPPDVDNARVDIRVEWESTDTDWDLYILNESGEVVGGSAAGGTSFENAVLLDPVPGKYTAVLVNYAGGATDDWGNGSVTFSLPKPATEGHKEAWTLTCEKPDGTVAAVHRVVVDRGETAKVGNACVAPKP